MVGFKMMKLIVVSFLVLLGSSMFIAACGCDDRACALVEVRLAATSVPVGGSFDVYVEGSPTLTCDSEGVQCGQDDLTVWFKPPHRPTTIGMIVLDAAGDEVARYDAKPKYGVIDSNLCGDCPGAAAVTVP